MQVVHKSLFQLFGIVPNVELKSLLKGVFVLIVNRDNHEDVKLNNQINQEISSTKHICKYQSLEKLGIVSYIVFFVYTMLVFNFIAISDSINTGNTTYNSNIILFLIIDDRAFSPHE